MHLLTWTPSMLNILEYNTSRDDEEITWGPVIGHKRVQECNGRDEEEIIQDPVIGCKRVQERKTTPFPNEQMEYNDHDNELILYDQPLDHEQPRKQVHRDLTFYDRDKDETPEGTNKLHATWHPMCRSPSLSQDALVIACDSDMPLKSEAAVNQNSSPNVKVINNVNKGQPKVAGYDSDVCTVLKTAIEIYCAILLMENPFPASVQEVDWAKNAWSLAGHHHNIKLTHDGGILRLVSFHKHHISKTVEQVQTLQTHRPTDP
ncbi:hypothetical protein BKA83DRAFT_4493167 [Pisolithus microcarpus]|nr:hypothetical protein BKA83DRAFT_4493167 [Pisolithus microcarpus]